MPSAYVPALLQHCFRETYGDVSGALQIRANPMPDRGDVVACAVDKALMEGIKAAVAKAGMRLVSVQPYFMSGFNAACKSIGGAAACFVQAEPGRIMLGAMRDKNWLGLRAVTASPQWKSCRHISSANTARRLGRRVSGGLPACAGSCASNHGGTALENEPCLRDL